MARVKTKDVYIDVEDFKRGLHILSDTTKAPFATARTMENTRVTDRGGVAPRLGTILLGTKNTNGNGCKGVYNFRKSFDSDEFLIKTYDDEMEVYSKNHDDNGWFRLKNGFTVNKEFGFVTSLVNTDNDDFVVFCNRFERYQRWQGAVTQLNGALSGAETDITVDSTLTDEIFESQTATSSSATTLTVSTATWATSQWVNLYVYVTSGALSGKIRKITSNNGTVITFDTLGSDPGNATFEIRKLAFPATGTIVYNGTTIAYTGIDTATTLQVGSAHAGDDNDVVTIVPTEFSGRPQGNRLTNYLSRIIVGNVRSAMARDSGGALQGYSSAGSYFVSELADPTSFDFTATRVAGEGDIISTPYGGGDITDVTHQEDTAYVFKKRYIESVKYSQDSNDLAVREPLKAEIGSVGRVIKGSDDIYFVTDDNAFTSIGRVRAKDLKPQTENLGTPIKRLLDSYIFGAGGGIDDDNKLYLPARQDSTFTDNNKVIVYNKENGSFESIHNLSAFGFTRFNGDLHFASSTGANIFKMNTGHSDVEGDDRFPITAKYATNFMNLTASAGNLQALNSLYFEGYIKGNSKVTFEAWKDLNETAFLSFDFDGTETSFLDGQELSASLGGTPITLRPMGTISDPDGEGRRHFMFRIFFPFVYGNFFSVGFNSSGEDYDYELTRFGLGLAQTVTVDSNRVKTL